MNEYLIKYLIELTLTKAHVNGFSKVLHNRIKDGKETTEECLRFYVDEKFPLKALNKTDVLPLSIEDIPVDVKEVGDWRVNPPLTKVKKPIKTERIRPLTAGISVGNLSITAGTFGWFYKKNGDILGGTNAHVNTDDPSNETSHEKRIVQPGMYDGASEEDIIGYYDWHQPIYPIGGNSGCLFANNIVNILNNLSKLFKRRTRFGIYLDIINNIDFGTFSLTEPYETRFIDYDISNGFLGVGHGFAGSDQTSLVCKGKYIEEAGYSPLLTTFVSPKVNDIVYKTGRTSCFSNAKIIDVAGVSQVNYGSFIALFDDVIVTEHLLDPGDSGSFVFLKEQEVK